MERSFIISAPFATAASRASSSDRLPCLYRPCKFWCTSVCIRFMSQHPNSARQHIGCWVATLVTAAQGDESSESAFFGVSPCVLFLAGAKYGPSIRFDYRIDRLFLPIILHASILHVLVNVISQLQLLAFFESDRNFITKKSLIGK